MRRSSILILTQVYPPDPASVGQHMADLADALSRRGHRVVVYTADRGYDDPGVRYARREVRDGVEVRRLRFSSFGKDRLALRIAGALSFLVQCLAVCLFRPGVRGIIFSTVPPFIGIAPMLARYVRRVPIAYWVMDLNPDQLIALGTLSPGSVVGRVLGAVGRRIAEASAVVVALDRFMAGRIRRHTKGAPVVVIPPWPHEDHIRPIAREESPFRRRLGLDDEFVVMYSGNHSPSNPLATMLRAAVRLRDDDGIRFLFVGGGVGKREVETVAREHGLRNVLSLPYQRLEDLSGSLSAADVHLVSLGDAMVGIIHPCKIYGAMAAARPIVYLGPVPSHIGDIVETHGLGWHVRHGDVDGAVALIRRLSRMEAPELERVGARARRVLRRRFEQAALQERMCEAVEAGLGFPGPAFAGKERAARRDAPESDRRDRAAERSEDGGVIHGC